MSDGILDQLLGLGRTARERQGQARVLLGAPEGAGRTSALFRLAERATGEGLKAVTVSLQEPDLLRAILRALASAAGIGQPTPEALAALPWLSTRDATARDAATAVLCAALTLEGPFTDDARQELAAWLAGPGTAVVICLDDAHLADAARLAQVEWLAHALDSVICLLVLSFEEGGPATGAFSRQLQGWRRDAAWTVLGLSPLNTAQLESTLLAAGVEGATAASLAATARGNPGLALGLVEIVRARGPGNTLPPPRTFEELRLARLAALGPQPLAVAQALAPLETDVPERLMRLALGGEAQALDTLQATGVLVLRSGRLGFADPRVVKALWTQGSGPLGDAVREAMGALARRELESQTHPADLDALVPLALPTLPPGTASIWHEVLANAAADPWAARAALEAALREATGVRRLVLLRRLAEQELAASEPERALATLAQSPRATTPALSAQHVEILDRLATHPRLPLDRWETLGADEAQAAVELTRAECLSQLVRREETRRAFEELERHLGRLRGPQTGLLWVRWAKAWSWFLCEILGAPAEALAACARARAHVPPSLLSTGDEALALLRAEEVAACSVGDFTSARQHVDEHLALAERMDRPREACLAWNARAILFFGHGQLQEARAGFERSLALGRRTGWLRREAIALHNLALVQCELGDTDGAWASESRYAQLSVQIANHAGTAEAPLVLAGVALARWDLPAAEVLLAQGRKAADANGWTMLTAWGRLLSAKLRLQRSSLKRDSLELSKARNDLLAALEAFEEHGSAWCEEFDPAEAWALYALLQHRSGQAASAREALAKASRLMPVQNVVSHRGLDLAEATVTQVGLTEALSWFADQGFVRRVALWRRLWLESARA